MNASIFTMHHDQYWHKLLCILLPAYFQVFVVGEDAQGQYLLPPGQYVVIIFTDNPGDERKFLFAVAHPKEDVSVSIR